MSIRLYDRRAVLQVGTVQIEGGGPDGMHFSFDADRSLKSATHPNSAGIKIYNLSSSNRGALTTFGSKRGPDGNPVPIEVRLEAGYKEGTSLIFAGHSKFIEDTREGPDRILVIEAYENLGLGKLAFKSWAKSTPIATIIRDLAKTLDMGTGNLPPDFEAQYLGGGTQAPGPTSVSGNAMRALKRFCHSVGLDVSLQAGQLLFLYQGNGALGRKAIVVSSETGMIGSPSVNVKGVITFQTLLTPGLVPGAIVNFQTDQFEGFVRVAKVRFSGSTFGADWFATCECEPPRSPNGQAKTTAKSSTSTEGPAPKKSLLATGVDGAFRVFGGVK